MFELVNMIGGHMIVKTKMIQFSLLQRYFTLSYYDAL